MPGTRSIGKQFELKGHQVYSIEWDKQHENIDWHVDIGTITLQDILDRFGVPDVIWSSFDCTSYSVAGISHHRRKDEDGNLRPISEYAQFCDNVNSHVVDLIKEFLEINPNMLYFIENPRGGLRKMNFMKDLPRYTVTYCQYNNPLVQELIFKMNEKKCPKCGKIKDIGEFYKNKSRRDGFSVYCKECIKEDNHEYYDKNKEDCKRRLQEWKDKNREYVRERDKRYREENPDIEFEKQKRYREKHKEKLYLKGKKYREEHKDYFYNKQRERRLAQKEVSDGTVTLEFEQFLLTEQNSKCAYCGCDLNESGKHLDHIIPISRGGLHSSENVHWTCPTCNLSKGNKMEDEWLKKERCKPTDLWSNHPSPKFKPTCKNGDSCHVAAPRGSRTGTQALKNAKERSIIPEQLCKHIVDICEEYIGE